MARGQLRVYLGSAPGVGKTYRMLDEGWRRRERGTDVVIGYVETHGRTLTVAQLRDLEVVPRVTREYRGANLEEMDLDAVLARHPRVVLVDELAHTNVPGGRHQKRWQDVEELLEAGIDVITTVNIQHLESVNDVVEKITGVIQRETVPDAVVRRAEQVELVDITPEALRRRMAHGNIYAADQIDASLSNYFRPGNLGALRELALLWLADRVEDNLQRYLDDHAIAAAWETRERLVVGVTGTAIDDQLLRRAARIASRSGAELLAVHVATTDAVRGAGADTALARELVGEFEGRFAEVVDDDVATALMAVARAERATQVVLGASRPRSSWRPPSGIVEKVLRHARDLDVHIIAVGGERPLRTHPRRAKSRLSVRRRVGALVGAALGLPVLTALMTLGRASISLSSVGLVYLSAVVVLTVWGGALAGVVAAVGAFGLENYYFVAPVHTLVIARPDDVVTLVAFLIFALAASATVAVLTQHSSEAERARAEARVLAETAAHVGGAHEDLVPLLDSLRQVFAASSVALLVRHESAWSTEVLAGEAPLDPGSGQRFPIDDDHALVVSGATLDDQDRDLVGAFAGRIAAGLRARVIAHDAAELRDLAEAESFRLALFRIAADDLRRPLEEIGAMVGALREPGANPALVKPRVAEVAERVHRLIRLVTNLVDAGRLEAAEVTPRLELVRVGDLVAGALDSVDTRGRRVALDVPGDLPDLATDPHLARRVIANVITNGCRFGPPDEPVRVRAGMVGDWVEVLVVDRGPGMDPAQRDAVLAPFDHLSGSTLSAGLNLTVASGLAQLLGGALRFEDTPGGGLTVVIELPLAGAARHP